MFQSALDLDWLFGSVAGFYEHSDETSGSIKKARCFFDKLSDIQLFR
jgi:hypothetical protein